ncbi:MAG TPA: Hsp20/alpha crystallin family protein [Spirochaetota bacterium]|nr:Hsp20/alpha crystallin family protein [Spirochaetota bacterium]
MKWGIANRNNDTYDMWSKTFDRIFDDFFSASPVGTSTVPALDIEEEKGRYVLTAELPGMEESDLDISVTDGVLTISGEKKEEKKKEEKCCIVSERRYGSFSRSIPLPKNIDTDKLKAKFEKGVLSIEMPKDEKAAPKKIKILPNK